MTLRPFNLMLPSELWGRLQQTLGDRPDSLQTFVIEAIEHELQREQPVSRKQVFWTNVATIRAEMASDGTSAEIETIWTDVRDTSPGREVAL